MPTHVVTCRLQPYAYDQLQQLARRRNQSLAATTAGLLVAALDDPAATATAQDGTLVTAVRAVLADVDTPQALLHRELALVLARSVERESPGHVAAVGSLNTMVQSALTAQRRADDPDEDPSLSALMESLGIRY